MRPARLTTTNRTRLLLASLAALALGIGAVAFAAVKAPALEAPTIGSHPADPTNQTSASFSFGDATAGVAFRCSLDGATFAACTSPTTYAGPLAQGSHTFRVEAVSGSKPSSATSYSWTVDTTPPRIKLAFPLDKRVYGAAEWAAGCAGGAGVCGSAQDDSGVASVRVSVLQQSSGRWWNGSSFSASSETFLTATGTSEWRLALALPAPDGSYTVHVRASDALGNGTSAAEQASASFQIETQPPAAKKAFAIAGSLAEALAPGVSRPLALTISNPNPVAIYVTGLTVTVRPGSSKAGCDGPSNLSVTQSNASSTNALPVPAGGQVTLPSGPVSAPQVLMLDLPTNQDACKDASFSFAYGGSAHS